MVKGEREKIYGKNINLTEYSINQSKLKRRCSPENIKKNPGYTIVTGIFFMTCHRFMALCNRCLLLPFTLYTFSLLSL
ncbi:hypothetical protein DMA11_03575 [Marinilabiliaceae bacterium JC017]|nr:hypothetical protein DMA11_03575 [Marinilabiliaceae bacterium JC017]